MVVNYFHTEWFRGVTMIAVSRHVAFQWNYVHWCLHEVDTDMRRQVISLQGNLKSQYGRHYQGSGVDKCLLLVLEAKMAWSPHENIRTALLCKQIDKRYQIRLAIAEIKDTWCRRGWMFCTQMPLTQSYFCMASSHRGRIWYCNRNFIGRKRHNIEKVLKNCRRS